MEINYLIVIPFTVVIVLLIAWLIRRNLKDEKKFEKDSNKSEAIHKPHDKDRI
jgi:hypothetical protein